MRDSQEHIIYGDLGRDAPPTEAELQAQHDRYWLRLAQQCHASSTDYLDQNLRDQWERNLAHFNNEHSKDSKFHSANYKQRNKLFRPKTRAIALRGEAALVRAVFATEDLISTTPQNPNDPTQVISAEINQELLQYRLDQTIPWFQTVIGAWQDCFNYGICISYQYWAFETRRRRVREEGVLAERGEQSFREEVEIIRNEPAIDLIEPENFRFDPTADWRDPVATSPFLERIVPMPLEQVEARMQNVDAKTGRPAWRQYDRGRIMAASRGYEENESTRMAREGQNRQDPHRKDQVPREYDTVFCREYIVREAGIDWVFWTIGDHLLLTDPVPIEEVYFHGKRPFRVGVTMIEAHKTIPASKNELIAPIQVAINKLTNQRADNVDLVLNKRYFLRRGQNIDTPALMRNVPGGGVYMDDPESDVKIVSTPDVTSSSYEEHNRLSNEMDEIAGNFSVASVQANRALNETVGGMQLNRASSDEITEYAINVFIKTWMEPVLQQLLWLEQAYEDDVVILQLAAGKSEGYQKLNLQGDIPLQLLMQELTVKVDVGIGNTDPITKRDHFTGGLATILQVMPQLVQRLDEEAVIKEVLGGAGRKDGSRFFKPAEEVQQGTDPAVAAAEAAEATRRYQIDQQTMLRLAEMDREDDRFFAELALTREMKLEDLYVRLGIEQQRGDLKRLSESNKRQELAFKALTGRQGI